MMRAGPLLILPTLCLLVACRKDNAEVHGWLEPQLTPYTLTVPTYFPLLEVPVDNPLTVEGIELGRRLYYDPLLSTGGPQAGHSCSSCHVQSSSFSEPGVGTAILPHVNLGWSSNFLWTGKVNGALEDIMMFEVDDFFHVDLDVLNEHPQYPALFQEVFGVGEITSDRVAKALAQWFRRLTSTNSKFDRYLSYTENLTAQEMNGMMIYLTEVGDCFHCHGIPLLTDNNFHNIGLDSVYAGSDQGRYRVTADPADLGAFKAPTLRNIALTAPYMHDGRFQTLEEVVEHYNSGVNPSPSLDPLMTKASGSTVLNLTPIQKADLVTFLHTFTDDVFVSDSALADPF